MSTFLVRGIFCRGINGFPIIPLTSASASSQVRTLVTIIKPKNGLISSSSISAKQFAAFSFSPTLLAGTGAVRTAASAATAAKGSDHGHDHTKIWSAEKLVSGALLPIIPLAFIFPCNAMDYLLAFTITLHSHWGIEALVVDYVRPSVFGPVIPKIGVGAVWALSALTLGGLCYFTYTDVGLVEAIKMLWKL